MTKLAEAIANTVKAAQGRRCKIRNKHCKHRRNGVSVLGKLFGF